VVEGPSVAVLEVPEGLWSKVRQWLCSMRGAVCVVVAVCTAAVASQACRFGEFTFSAARVPSLINHDVDEDLNGTTRVEVTACRYELAPFVSRHETIYYSVYYWSRVIFIHVIPCCALVLLNTSPQHQSDLHSRDPVLRSGHPQR